jgi:Glutamate-cysteine ligase family 2(GCS2)
MYSKDFGFGIEAEFLLVDSNTFRPLAHNELNFKKLLKLVDDISTEDLSREGFNTKPLHNRPSPYLIEGYTLTDENMKPVDLLPKGIEIRTPLANSLTGCTASLQELYRRLKTQLLKENMNAAAISYHPTSERIVAPRNYERYDYWQWALTATTTYGPDINISLPTSLEDKVNIDRVNSRVNFYGPAAVALTLASPLRENDLWRVNGKIGKSVRTFERSKWAPLIYVHEKPSLRFEFKGFEMSTSLDDYHALFLISLALLLDESLNQKGSDEERISDLESVAVSGLDDERVQERAYKVLQSAESIARQFNFKRESLDEFWHRLHTKRHPADAIAATFIRTGPIEKTLLTLTDLNSTNSADLINASPSVSLCLA